MTGIDAKRPNVILILVDDMGFSDLGITGAEIRTPAIDALARGGALFSAMYNCARCCPTRAALLTGLYPHQAGIGHMGVDLGGPAYQGYLRNDSATIAEMLRAAGYRTLMSGKWHVAGDFDARDCDNWRVGDVAHPSPRQRGFDRFYGSLDGAQSFFAPHYVMEDDRRITIAEEDYYFTDAITDRAIAMIDEAGQSPQEARQPFFLYLAHTAPHWPLHAHEEDIARYDGIYDAGWDIIRGARYERMNAGGLFPARWDLSPRDAQAPPWTETPDHAWEARKMAVYAAMIDRMDQSVGRLVQALAKRELLDDSLILFLSDNGGCAEFLAEDGWAKFYPDTTPDGRRILTGNRADVTPGGIRSFQSYGRPWANLSNAPFRQFKHYVHEGGISTPMIAHWPNGLTPHTAPLHDPCHVVDILPTILDATGCPALSELGGHGLQPLQGESLLPLLYGKNRSREQPIFWEHEGNAAIRAGRFKLVRRFDAAWELYDMETDRTETRDLAAGDGPRVAQLARQYDAWAAHVGVRDWRELSQKLLAFWQLDHAEG